MGVVITFVVLRGFLADHPLVYSFASEQPTINYPNSVLSQNETFSRQSDAQVEVHKTMRYSERVPLQLKSPYYISVPIPSFYEGDIWIDDLFGEMFENGDVEDNNLARWGNELSGTTDFSKLQRLNSTNVYDYRPSTQGDDYFFFFNGTSFSTYWFVDYYANQRFPSSSLLISFQYANRLESLLSQQTNMDLQIRFDFVAFDVIFFLYTKSPRAINYNKTISDERYVHFLLNTTWSPNWIDIGPINVTAALLSLDMYNITNLPRFFHLNQVLIECFATPPYQFHLLVDNLSLKTQILPTQLEFLVNGTRFSEVEENTSKVRVQGFTTDDLQFKLSVSNASIVDPNKLTGYIVFDLWFRENLPLLYYFVYVNQTYVSWDVLFNISNYTSDLLPKRIEIRVPATWSLFTFQNPHHKEILQECLVKSIENIYLIEFCGDLALGSWHFVAFAPNYINSIQISPVEVEQNSFVQLSLVLRSSLENPVTVSLLRDGDDIIYFNTSQFASTDGSFLLNIPINNDFPKGNYTITAQISAGFCGGIQYASITVLTHSTRLIVDFPPSIMQYEPLFISVQMVDLSTHLSIAAEFFYAWDNNELFALIKSEDKYQIALTGLSPGNHSLIIEGRSPGYSTARKTVNITIIPSILIIELDSPNKVYPNDIVTFQVRVVNNFSRPVPELDVHLRIDGTDVAKSTTDLQGYSFIIWEVPTNVSNDIFVEIIVSHYDKILGTVSQNMQIEKRGSYKTWLQDLMHGSELTLFISVFTFVLSSMFALYRHRRSEYVVLFGEEVSQKQQNVE